MEYLKPILKKIVDYLKDDWASLSEYPKYMSLLKHILKVHDNYCEARVDKIMWTYFDGIIKNIDSDVSYMYYFVCQFIKMMSQIPLVADWIANHASYYNKLYEWITDNPNPSKGQRFFDYVTNASQIYNLNQLKRVKNGEL